MLFKKAGQEDFENINTLRADYMRAAATTPAFRQQCIIGATTKIIFYIWLNYDRMYDIDSYNIKLSSGKQAYLFDAFTLPEYRGKSIFPAALLFICNHLRDKKYQKCFITSTIENKASIRGIRKAGFKMNGYILKYTIGNRKKTIFSKRLLRSITMG